MNLIERDDFLATLQIRYEKPFKDGGHSILISGEAGIGKTSLVRAFCKERQSDCIVYQGTCDALFTPRPLAPLYDIAMQMGNGILLNNRDAAGRAGLYTRLFYSLVGICNSRP